jgi:Tol biopolymer transport system component/predicted Ser/Thr protein kinase
MSISIGDKLGPYEILEPIGKGGMGEVYRARDTRLNRDVAVKVSAEQFSERFEREARAIASLNHPNICHLYDVGPNYLVMELVEGPTLAERIKQSAIPFEEALAIAGQIADALDAAHEKGITHRDLKPGNIKIKPDGTVKVLDFGLAKMGGTPTVHGDHSPTLTMGQTEAGMILGTASYMSPEQAKGKVVDQRSDIYAFGVVLYEMLTGKRLHHGETTTEVLASVIKEEPQWDNVPAQVQRLLRRCLEKDPQKRLRHIGDVMSLVDDTPVAPITAPATAEPRGRSRTVFVSAVACVLGAVVVGLSVWFLKPTPPKPVSRFAMSLPPGQRLFTGRPELAISPDGTRMVYAAGQNLNSIQLYLRAMDGLDARAIPGTEVAAGPFFSPDGQWIGFSAGGKLKKVSLSGGPPVSLADVAPAGGAFGANWSSQGTIAFAPRVGSPIQQVSDAGGSVQPLTGLEKGILSGHGYPELLPSGTGLLFSIFTGGANVRKIVVQSLKTGERRELLPSGDLPRYAPSGHIVYLQGANLMAVPFDLGRLAITGAAVPVIEGVLPLQYSFSSNGSLVYVPGSSQAPQLKLVWVDRKGGDQPLPAPAHNYVMPRISPDGRRVATALEEGDSQVWIYDLGRDALTRLTFQQGDNVDPVWMPDGKRIVFKGAANRLFWQPSDGSGAAEALTSGPLSTNDIPSSWSPDGQAMAIVETIGTQGVWILPLQDRKPQLFDRGQTNETAPRFSPDGHWIAYTSGESGRVEIYVRPYPGPGGKYQISTEGGTEPVWNPKGRELFYRAGNKMMAVEVATQPAFSAGKPKVLFEGAYVATPRSLPNYDVSPDGQRFLMLEGSEQGQAPTQINVVLNWFEELKRRVPSGTK